MLTTKNRHQTVRFTIDLTPREMEMSLENQVRQLEEERGFYMDEVASLEKKLDASEIKNANLEERSAKLERENKALKSENKVLKTTVEKQKLEAAYSGAESALRKVPSAFSEAVAKLEAKLNKSKQKNEVSEEPPAKLKLNVDLELEVKFKQEQEKCGKLRSLAQKLNGQLEIYRALLASLQNMVRNFSAIATENMKGVEQMFAILDDDVDSEDLKLMENEEDETEKMTGSDNRGPEATPPAAVLQAINMLSAEDLKELESLDFMGLEDNF